MSLIEQSLAYWQSIRGDRQAPQRIDFDPADIPRLLPNVVFLDVIDSGSNFRFRVIGDAVRSASHGNYTGQMVDSLPHITDDGPLMTALRKAVVTRQPVHASVPYTGPVKEVTLREHLVMPLTGENGEVTHLLVTIDLVISRR